jgi:hypothetical protein
VMSCRLGFCITLAEPLINTAFCPDKAILAGVAGSFALYL